MLIFISYYILCFTVYLILWIPSQSSGEGLGFTSGPRFNSGQGTKILNAMLRAPPPQKKCLFSSIATLAFFGFHLPRISFSIPSLSVFVYFYNWGSLIWQHIDGSQFLKSIQSFCLLIEFSPHTFKVIIDRYVLLQFC